jgi:hypothetical protein
MFVPRIDEGQRAARGASLLQGWLNIAKQRAMRDQQARGLRLYVSGGIVTDCQYLDLPDDFSGGTLKQGAALNQVILQADANGNGDLSAGQSNSALWSVQPGDSLLLLRSGLVHQIQLNPAAITQTGISPSTFTITLAYNLSVQGPGGEVPAISQPTRNYRILRSPRVSGEEKLSLPQSIGIDLSTNTTYGNNLVPNQDGSGIDILVAPSGTIIGDQASLDKIILWVRDVSLPTPFDGEPTLITVYNGTGLVAAVPVDPANPYNFPNNP